MKPNTIAICKAVASVAICAAVAVAVCKTGNPMCLWGLFFAMVIW